MQEGRDNKGKFVKGFRSSISTEFRKGEMCGASNPFFGKKHTLETRAKIKAKRALQDMSKRRGIPMPMQARIKVSESRRGKSVGSDRWNWKGGVSLINSRIRKTKQYRWWRELVFRRDDYTCQKCGKRGGDLHAHHDFPFSLFPDLRFEVLNGITLCVPCHRNTDSYGRSIINLMKEIYVS